MSTTELAIIVPAAVAVLALVVNAWMQVRINRQTLDHEHKLAVQGRIVSTYEDMLEMINLQMDVVAATKPIFGAPAPPKAPSGEAVRGLQARIGLHGSPKVKEILERWATCRNEFYAAAERRDSKQWQEVQALRTKLNDLVSELEDAANSEMRG